MDHLLPVSRNVMRVWLSKKPDDKPPFFNAFTLEELQSFLRNLITLEIDQGLSSSRIVSMGSEAVELLGRDWTGHTLLDVALPSNRPELERMLRQMVETRAPVVLRGAFLRPEATPDILERLALPCRAGDGQLSRALVVITAVPGGPRR